MAGESVVQVNSGSGPKLHTWNRTVGGVGVEDEFVIPGEYPYASYSVTPAGVSIAIANDHMLQIMAGGTLNVRLRRFRIFQEANATAANVALIQLIRLTSAGTGGTAVTPRPFETADVAAGCTAMTLPTAKGTEGVTLWQQRLPLRQGFATTGSHPDPVLEWTELPNMKPIIIPAGTTNGLCWKVSGNAGATAGIYVELVELNY